MCYGFSGLQSLCNTFESSHYRDILVGAPVFIFPHYCLPQFSSIRGTQGSVQQPAGNKFSKNVYDFENQSSHNIDYHYYNGSPNENPNPNVIPNTNKISTSNQNSCSSHFGRGAINSEDLESTLSQYDEWNEQYDYWLSQLLSTEPDGEEYNQILSSVSYFSALKDNYFNSIIVAVMNEEEEEAEGGKRRFDFAQRPNAEGDENLTVFPSYALTVSKAETLRFLFAYRGQYQDYLSITETYLAENNFEEALLTISKMYEQFRISEEQFSELKGMEAYTRWLQQLEEKNESIYSLPRSEVEYLTNYVATNTGRGKVFANNILCVLYNICLEEVESRKRRFDFAQGLNAEGDETLTVLPSYALTVSKPSASYKNLEDITLVPNPTTGELRITNYELRNGLLSEVEVEVFDVYGRKVSSHHHITSSSHHLINISHLSSGVYFVKIKTDGGETVKKVVKM
jgi:hypothetical protein